MQKLCASNPQAIRRFSSYGCRDLRQRSSRVKFSNEQSKTVASSSVALMQCLISYCSNFRQAVSAPSIT